MAKSYTKAYSEMGLAQFGLFWKIYIVYSSLFLLTLGLTAFMASVQLKEFMLGEKQMEMKEKISLLVPYLEEYLSNGNRDALFGLMKRVSETTSFRVSFFDAQGQVIADSEAPFRPAPLTEAESHIYRPEMSEALRSEYGVQQRLSESLGRPFVYIAKAIRNGAQLYGFIRVAIPSETILDRLYDVKYLVVGVAVLGALFHLLIGLLISRRMTVPITEMMGACDAIRQGHYERQVKTLPKDEIGRLGDTINKLGIEITKKIATISVERAQLRAMIDSMVEGVVSVDRSGHVIFCNDAAFRLLNSKPRECNRLKLHSVEGFCLLQEAVENVLRKNDRDEGEIVFLSDVGQKTVIEYHAGPFTTAEKSGIVVVLHDVTRIRQLERIRRDFVANVSHEIKTPLTSIKGYIETLLDGAMDDSRAKTRFLKKISANADRLVSLVQDIISLAQIENIDEHLVLSEQRWYPVIEQVLAEQDSEIQRKNLSVQVEGETDCFVFGDRDSMVQVLDNLISNAVRYSQTDGNLKLTLSRDATHTRLEVRDNGPGISPIHLGRIFERFYRVDKDRSRQLGGTGLGLAIVKHLVQKMSGDVRAQSRVGEGTSFTISMPYRETVFSDEPGHSIS